MIITALRTAQTYQHAQSKNRAEARTRRIEGYRYSYVLGGVTPAEITLDDACDVIDCIMFDVMRAGETKDMETTEDESCPLFSFRFFSQRRLAKSYSVELLWLDINTETDEKGNPIITDETPLYGKDELPENLESLIPICVEIIEIQ